jgi:hypothetical protein
MPSPPPQQNGHTDDTLQDADFAKVHSHYIADLDIVQKAFQELNRGEQTAAALESHLSALEAKIDELLAATAQQGQSQSSSSSAQPPSTTGQ